MSQREQQTARVNVDDETWQAFRIRAIQANRSVADGLTRLVRNDLRRARPTLAAIDEQAVGDGGAGGPRYRTAERATTKVQCRRSRQRLADLDLLTGLPYRDQPPP